jgi:hypothetical protein
VVVDLNVVTKVENPRIEMCYEEHWMYSDAVWCLPFLSSQFVVCKFVGVVAYYAATVNICSIFLLLDMLKMARKSESTSLHFTCLATSLLQLLWFCRFLLWEVLDFFHLAYANLFSCIQRECQDCHHRFSICYMNSPMGRNYEMASIYKCYFWIN